jgi:hypothetical protein
MRGVTIWRARFSASRWIHRLKAPVLGAIIGG